MKKKASLPPPLCDAFEEEEEKKIQSLRIDRADDRWRFLLHFLFVVSVKASDWSPLVKTFLTN